MVAIGFAFASMLCAGINDFVFKVYSRQRASLGAYLALIGLVWTLFFGALGCRSLSAILEPVTLYWGVVSGLFGLIANVLLIEGMRRLEAGVAATIYRLNLGPAAILAFLLLGESATVAKWLGIAAAVLAVLAFCSSSDGAAIRDRWGLLLMVLACLLRAGMGISYKCGLSNGAQTDVMLALNGVVWLVGGLLYHALAKRRHRLDIGKVVWRYGLLSGSLVCGIVLFLMQALRYGDASVVLPIAQLSFVGTGILGVTFLHEALNWRKVAGMLLALVCVLLLTVEG